MTVRTVKSFRAIFPTPILSYPLAFYILVEEEVRGSSKILLPMCIIAVTPFMFLIDIRAKRSLVTVKHEFFQGQLFFKLI